MNTLEMEIPLLTHADLSTRDKPGWRTLEGYTHTSLEHIEHPLQKEIPQLLWNVLEAAADLNLPMDPFIGKQKLGKYMLHPFGLFAGCEARDFLQWDNRLRYRISEFYRYHSPDDEVLPDDVVEVLRAIKNGPNNDLLIPYDGTIYKGEALAYRYLTQLGKQMRHYPVRTYRRGGLPMELTQKEIRPGLDLVTSSFGPLDGDNFINHTFFMDMNQLLDTDRRHSEKQGWRQRTMYWLARNPKTHTHHVLLPTEQFLRLRGLYLHPDFIEDPEALQTPADVHTTVHRVIRPAIYYEGSHHLTDWRHVELSELVEPETVLGVRRRLRTLIQEGASDKDAYHRLEQQIDWIVNSSIDPILATRLDCAFGTMDLKCPGLESLDERYDSSWQEEEVAHTILSQSNLLPDRSDPKNPFKQPYSVTRMDDVGSVRILRGLQSMGYLRHLSLDIIGAVRMAGLQN